MISGKGYAWSLCSGQCETQRYCKILTLRRPCMQTSKALQHMPILSFVRFKDSKDVCMCSPDPTQYSTASQQHEEGPSPFSLLGCGCRCILWGILGHTYQVIKCGILGGGSEHEEPMLHQWGGHVYSASQLSLTWSRRTVKDGVASAVVTWDGAPVLARLVCSMLALISGAVCTIFFYRFHLPRWEGI